MRVLFGTTTVAVAGTRTQLSNTADPVKRIQFQARAANMGNMFVGLVDVSATVNGWEFSPEVASRGRGELSLDFGAGSVLLNKFYVDSAVSGEIIDWVAVVVP